MAFFVITFGHTNYSWLVTYHLLALSIFYIELVYLGSKRSSHLRSVRVSRLIFHKAPQNIQTLWYVLFKCSNISYHTNFVSRWEDISYLTAIFVMSNLFWREIFTQRSSTHRRALCCYHRIACRMSMSLPHAKWAGNFCVGCSLVNSALWALCYYMCS